MRRRRRKKKTTVNLLTIGCHANLFGSLGYGCSPPGDATSSKSCVYRKPPAEPSHCLCFVTSDAAIESSLKNQCEVIVSVGVCTVRWIPLFSVGEGGFNKSFLYFLAVLILKNNEQVTFESHFSRAYLQNLDSYINYVYLLCMIIFSSVFSSGGRSTRTLLLK